MIFYGLACVVAYLLTAWANADARGRYADSLGVVSMLVVSYGLTNAMVAVWGLPEAILGFPIVDLVFTYMVFRAWRREKAQWKLIMAGLFVCQLAAHTAFIFSWYTSGASAYGLYVYIVIINVAFGLQLLTAGSAGARHAVGRAIGYLSDRRRAYSGAHGR